MKFIPKYTPFLVLLVLLTLVVVLVYPFEQQPQDYVSYSCLMDDQNPSMDIDTGCLLDSLFKQSVSFQRIFFAMLLLYFLWSAYYLMNNLGDREGLSHADNPR